MPEDNRYLDVPITTEEFKQKSNERQKLLAEDEVRHARNDNYDPAIGRFKSLRTSIYSSDSSVHAVRPTYGHQRLPSSVDDQFHEDPYLRQPTSYTRDPTHDGFDNSPKLWRPVWLRKSVLGLFLSLYLAILVALVLLWHYSQSLNGFHVSSSASQYAWTYAPTAVLVIIVSLWRQVDYYTKLLAPWDELRKGPVSASRSLLADYLSPINFVSLFVAFKRGYIPIIATILGFFSLKIMTIFSAALFVQYPTIVVSPSSPLTSHKAFEADAFPQSSLLNSSSYSADPVYSTIGNIAYGLPYQPGVTAQYAYIPVELDRSLSDAFVNTTFTTQTDVFFPDLSCEPFEVGLQGSGIARANRTTTNTTSNQISLRLPDGNICDRWAPAYVYAMNPQKEATPPQQIEGSMQRVYCADEGEAGGSGLEPAGLLYTITNIYYAQAIFENGTIANSTRTVSNISSILCIPSYYLLTANITNNTLPLNGDGVTMNVSAIQNRTLDGLSQRNMAVLYDGVMNASQGVFGTRRDNPLTLEIPTTGFNLMAMVMNQTSLQPFFDTGAMKKAAETTFSHVMSHFATNSLTTSAQKNASAATTYTANKLHVDNVAFYILIVGSAVLIICAALLLLVSPGPLVPKDPSLIAMPTVVLARSPELNQLLRKQQTLSAGEMKAILDRQEYGTAIATTEQGHNSFKIVASDATPAPNPSWNGPTLQWWNPNRFVIPATVLAAVLSFVLIAVLEVVQRRSDDDGGLMTVAGDANTNLYMRCIPVLVFLLLAAMISILDFYIALLAPWSKLDKGNAGAKRSLFTQLLGKLPPAAFLEAVKSKHIAAILSIAAGAVASVFAIVSSDLYSVNTVTVAGPSQQMLSKDAFHTQNSYNVLNDYGAAGLVNMIGRSDMPYPDGTFDELVLPNYSLESMHDSSLSVLDSIAGPYSATIPALRANLQCDVTAAQNMEMEFVPKSRNYDTDHWRFNVSYDLPKNCQLAGPHQNQSVLHFHSFFNVTNNETVLYGGKMYDLLFGANSSVSSNYGEGRAASIGDNPAVGCPSLAFLFAEFKTDSRTAIGSSLVCYQQIQQLQANLTYLTNSSIVNQHRQPGINETGMKILPNLDSKTGATTFDWRIQHNIERQLYGLDGARLQSNNTAVSYDFDAFFSYIFNNTQQQGPENIISSGINVTLPIAINHAYRQYMAQAINVGMRQPTTSGSGSIIARQTSGTGPEMLTQITRPRLVQNKASKLALQILLGIAALFCILAYTLAKFNHVLPYNPCSIAGTMSLLAGSDLCYTPDDALCECCGKPRRSSWDISTMEADPNDYHIQSIARYQMIPDGAEWMHDTRFLGVFATNTYSMGWWKEDRAKMRRRRFGVDVGARPDGEDEGDWELGDRRSVSERGFEGFMMRGRDAIGDSRGAYRSQRVDESPPPADGAQRTYDSPRRVRFEDEI